MSNLVPFHSCDRRDALVTLTHIRNAGFKSAINIEHVNGGTSVVFEVDREQFHAAKLAAKIAGEMLK